MNPLFDKESAVGTVIILFLFALLSFVVACFLGLFVDPEFGQDTRISVVLGWGLTQLVAIPIICLSRHG